MCRGFFVKAGVLYDKINFPMATLEKRNFLRARSRPYFVSADGDSDDEGHRQMYAANVFGINDMHREVYFQQDQNLYIISKNTS